jgi:hypothetical protein
LILKILILMQNLIFLLFLVMVWERWERVARQGC